MNTIVLIGAGQIGSRHLQSLKAINIPSEIWVFDSSKESLSLARQRYYEAPADTRMASVNFTTNLFDLPKCVDLLFFTTGSGPRFSLLKQFTSFATVKYIIFEKVLFQKVEHYYDALNILSEKKIKAWVNCNNRTFKFYRNIRTQTNTSPLLMTVSGGRWGLCCNAIHYIDLMSFLCGEEQYEINLCGLDKQLVESKRPGYKELFGIMRLDFKDGSQMIIHCNDKDTKRLLSISSTEGHIVFDEDTMRMWSSIGDLSEIADYTIPYQSQLTASLVESIISTGECLLPSYSQSMKLHLPLIRGLIEYINNNCGYHSDNCPIT